MSAELLSLFTLFLVLLGAGINMIVGMMWYSPMLFGNVWMKEMGIDPKKMKNMGSEVGKLYFLAFWTAVVQSFVLRLFIGFFGLSSVENLVPVLVLAFWLWLGFVMTTQFTDKLFSGKSFTLFLINTGYQLTSVVLMAVVIGVLS